MPLSPLYISTVYKCVISARLHHKIIYKKSNIFFNTHLVSGSSCLVSGTFEYSKVLLDTSVQFVMILIHYRKKYYSTFVLISSIFICNLVMFEIMPVSSIELISSLISLKCFFLLFLFHFYNAGTSAFFFSTQRYSKKLGPGDPHKY